MVYPLFALMCVLVIWAAGFFLIRRWPGDRSMSISLHAVAHRSAFWYFASVTTVIGVAFTAFLTQWFIPTFHLPWWFTAVYLLSFAAQLITAWVPDRPGWRRPVHRLAAYGMALLWLVLTIMLAASAELSVFARWFSALGAMVMVGSLVVAMHPRQRPNYLIYQTTYVMVLDVVFLVATFAR
ncbi:hypothetical protein HJC99_03015 [Candidatus Saccharibacteria bacterium]|nr:hypothetical protein [Candidatus Saccharibacteria bacterium]